MWYSRKQSVEMVEKYEIENNMQYDMVLLTRFDIALFKQFKFNEYNLLMISTNDCGDFLFLYLYVY